MQKSSDKKFIGYQRLKVNMRILEVSFRNPYKEGSGGLESYIYGLSNYLTSVGVEVKVIYCEKSQNIKEKNSKNTVCINIPKIIAYFKLDKMLGEQDHKTWLQAKQY